MGKLVKLVVGIFIISPLLIGHFLAWMSHHDLYTRTLSNGLNWLIMVGFSFLCYYLYSVYIEFYNIEQKYKKLREDRNLFK